MIWWLQDRYIDLLEPFKPWVMRIPVTLRYKLITLCFMADILLFGIVRFVLDRGSYIYNTILGIILMMIIAVLSLDKGGLKRVHWRRSVWIAWFGMCAVFTASDILVAKSVCGLGLVLAFVFTMVFFVWQNNSRRDLLWECFKKSVRISFIVMSLVSFLFRPMYEGVRYSGIFTNPNTFGLYLFIIFSVFMSDLDWEVVTGMRMRKCIRTYFCIALVLFYLSASQSRTAMLAVGMIFFMWVVFKVQRAVKTHAWRSFLKNVLGVICFSVALFPVFRLGAVHIPDILNTPLVFEGEDLYLSDGGKIYDYGEMIVKEGADDIERVMEKEEGREDLMLPSSPDNVWERFFSVLENIDGINAITSGRIGIYKGYIRNLNYEGHSFISLMVDGSRESHAHNNWLQFGYTYGYFGMLFYAIVTVLGVGMSIKFYIKRSRKNLSYAFLIPAICVGFLVATLTECLFLPFEVFPAFAYWFSFGDIFVKKVPKNRMLAVIEGED